MRDVVVVFPPRCALGARSMKTAVISSSRVAKRHDRIDLVGGELFVFSRWESLRRGAG
jgi:hypothetical protein